LKHFWEINYKKTAVLQDSISKVRDEVCESASGNLLNNVKKQDKLEKQKSDLKLITLWGVVVYDLGASRAKLFFPIVILSN
jgi:hypothetical protein